MKKSHLFCLVYTVIATIAFMGCAVSAGILKPDDTPTNERSVIISDGRVALDGVKLLDDALRHNNIVTAGKHRVVVTSSRTMETGFNSYIAYKETWRTDYEFKPGKVYDYKLIYAVLKYDRNTWSLRTDTPGVRLEEIAKNTVLVIHNIDTDIEIIESGGGLGGGMIGSTYIGPYLGGEVGLGLWDFGPSAPVVFGGPALGLQMIHGKFGMNLAGNAGVELGYTFPGFNADNFTILTGCYYGGMVEFVFSNTRLGVGYGMTYGSVDYADSPYYFPFVEINYSYRKDNLQTTLGYSIFGRYYLNDADGWYNKFAVGMKVKW